jgi:formate C-acetyltransferase
MELQPNGSSETFEAIRSSGPPRVALERAIYFTESFKTTEEQPLVLR